MIEAKASAERPRMKHAKYIRENNSSEKIRKGIKVGVGGEKMWENKAQRERRKSGWADKVGLELSGRARCVGGTLSRRLCEVDTVTQWAAVRSERGL